MTPPLAEVLEHLPVDKPAVSRAESVRTAILAEASLHRDMPRRAGGSPWRWAAAGSLAAAAAVLAVMWFTRAPGNVEHALVVLPAGSGDGVGSPAAPAAPGKAGKVRKAGPDSALGHLPPRIRLGNGNVTLGGAGTPVRASAGKIGIDLDGVAQVEVAGDRLVALRVRTGRATLRLDTGESHTVFAGERWTARVPAESTPLLDEPAPAAKLAPKPNPKPKRMPGPRPRPGPGPKARTKAPAVPAASVAARPKVSSGAGASSPAERAFERGWSALKSGRYASAAVDLARVSALGGAGQLVENARYWHGVALARAGRSTSARASMSDFLRRYPRSGRAAKVSVMLGWLHYDAGDRTSARKRFSMAVRRGDAAVRTSARDGLRLLDAPK